MPTAYPGVLPGSDCLIARGFVEPVPFGEVAERLEERGAAPLEDRAAVVSVGSNGSPARLVEKCGEDAVIPLAVVPISGWSAVYSAHITRYGSIAASLWRDPDAVTSFVVAFLDERQLEAVDGTEPNYERVSLGGSLAGWINGFSGYRSWRGALAPEGTPIRLNALASTSLLASAGQREVLDDVADRSNLASDGWALAEGVRSGRIAQAAVIEWMEAGRRLAP